MITVEEAYRIIKKYSKKPITYLIESEEYYLSTGDEYLRIRKDSGAVEITGSYVDFIIKIGYGKYVALEEMFEDYMKYYKKHNNEQTLAELYALKRFLFVIPSGCRCLIGIPVRC